MNVDFSQGLAPWRFNIGTKEPLAKPAEVSPFRRIAIADRRDERDTLELKDAQDTAPILPLFTMFRILGNDRNENIRESAIKALVGHGGERAVTVLESLVFGRELAGFGQDAAGKALNGLGLMRNDRPLIDPDRLHSIFEGLVAVNDASLNPARCSEHMSEVVNLQMLVPEIIGFSPEDTELFRVDADIPFDVNHAEEVSKARGLETRLIGDNAIQISGNCWPGFAKDSPELDITFWVHSHEGSAKSTLMIFSGGRAGTAPTTTAAVSRLPSTPGRNPTT